MTETKKKPQDHKPKTALDPETTFAIEVNGRKWTVDMTALASWDVLEDIGEVDAGNATRAPRLIKALLGPQQYLTARASFGTGEASVERGVLFVRDLLTGLNEARGIPNS